MAKGFTNSIIGGSEGLYAWGKYSVSEVLSDKVVVQPTSLPFVFTGGYNAVIYYGKINILQSNFGHYEWDEENWVRVSSMPFTFDESGAALSYSTQIHTFYNDEHYIWGGGDWSLVGTLPYYFYYGAAVVYNDEIHILGSESQEDTGEHNYKKHYKWDGSSWTEVSTLPYNFYRGVAVVYNNKIHILGSAQSGMHQKHYEWDGESWQESTIVPSEENQTGVTFEDGIHIFCSDGQHYKWNDMTWSSLTTLTQNISYNSATVVYDNRIYILGGSTLGDQWIQAYGYLPSYTFKDYIVSDKADAYPNDGEQGGYYYKSVGKLDFECGVVTATTDTTTITVNHNLGVKPSYCSLVSMGAWGSFTDSTLVVAPDGYAARSIQSGNKITATATQITFTAASTSYDFSGVTYLWAAYK